MLSLDEIESAAAIVHGAMSPTAQYAWPLLALRTGCETWVKHENHTPTGAFKVRGGLVFMDRLKRRSPGAGGVISATRGNHGQSIALAAARNGIAATIVVERDGHKGMIIGEKGEKLKRIGTEARHELEALTGGKVFLEIWVKVRSGWADDEARVKTFGYE